MFYFGEDLFHLSGFINYYFLVGKKSLVRVTILFFYCVFFWKLCNSWFYIMFMAHFLFILCIFNCSVVICLKVSPISIEFPLYYVENQLIIYVRICSVPLIICVSIFHQYHTTLITTAIS